MSDNSVKINLQLQMTEQEHLSVELDTNIL